VVLLNKDPVNAHDIQLTLGKFGDDADDEDFFPAGPWKEVKIRDLYARKDLGSFSNSFQLKVPPMDAAILKITPLI